MSNEWEGTGNTGREVWVRKVGGREVRSTHAELGWEKGTKHQASVRTPKETEHPLHCQTQYRVLYYHALSPSTSEEKPKTIRSSFLFFSSLSVAMLKGLAYMYGTQLVKHKGTF